MRVQLICENVGFDDIEFVLIQTSLVLGRSIRAELQVPHPLISRLHCEWKLVNGQLMLKDLESTNQTLINGEPIQQAVVRSGDRVLLGDVLYIVEIEDARPDFPPQSFAESLRQIEPNRESENPTTRLAMKGVSSPDYQN